MTTAAAGLPIHSLAIQQLFAAHTFREGTLPSLVTDPSAGFEPTRLDLGPAHPAHGTEVLFFPTPESMGPAFAAEVAPSWENGAGLILYRNSVSEVLGAIFVHGLIRNPWNLIQPDAYQSLGGIMLFSDHPQENKTAVDLIRDVIRKSVAMTLKWQFIDMNIENVNRALKAGIPPLLPTSLGGGKSTASHPDGLVGRLNAMITTAAIANMLGFYISGSDQNMTPVLCSLFSQFAAKNFMGAWHHPIPSYAGMGDPSPWTALGGAESLRVVRRRLLSDERVPILFQGSGNAGAPLIRHMVREDGHPLAGLVERNFEKLQAARKEGFSGAFFLEVPEGVQEPDAAALKQFEVTVVRDLVEAIQLAQGALIFSPNAGPHPINMAVADALIAAGFLAVSGITNNVHDLVNGSVGPVVRRLQKAKVYSGNDSEGNQMGAFSVTIGRVNTDRSLDKDLVTRLAQGVGIQTELMVDAFLRGESPQLARDREAARRYNGLLDQGLAHSGRIAV